LEKDDARASDAGPRWVIIILVTMIRHIPYDALRVIE
jgi:hypothetical protein